LGELDAVVVDGFADMVAIAEVVVPADDELGVAGAEELGARL
jgi:hypothetical protein